MIAIARFIPLADTKPISIVPDGCPETWAGGKASANVAHDRKQVRRKAFIAAMRPHPAGAGPSYRVSSIGSRNGEDGSLSDGRRENGISHAAKWPVLYPLSFVVTADQIGGPGVSQARCVACNAAMTSCQRGQRRRPLRATKEGYRAPSRTARRSRCNFVKCYKDVVAIGRIGIMPDRLED